MINYIVVRMESCGFCGNNRLVREDDFSKECHSCQRKLAAEAESQAGNAEFRAIQQQPQIPINQTYMPRALMGAAGPSLIRAKGHKGLGTFGPKMPSDRKGAKIVQKYKPRKSSPKLAEIFPKMFQ